MSVSHQTTYLKDYQPYPYDLKTTELVFQIFDGYTLVKSKLSFSAKPEKTGAELFLNGEDMELISIQIDGTNLTDYQLDDKGLRFTPSAASFVLAIETKIYPEKNTRLEGLYQSGGTYCTQCEAEGFRRITFFPDRPDVMSIYTVRIEADSTQQPILLSNGNKTEEGPLDNGRHYALWHDPHKKPCYLFALVAADLVHIHDRFTTASGRNVDLYIYVRDGDEGQCAHAMDSLKRSMKWDEEVYGLEYDLDIFNIVAVSDFNMGAMENKSLNIFNTALVLAHTDTATDLDFMRVESVIAHEYFHNWSGNRITCRDWFQLSLKEGLTVFRDQEFSGDTHSTAVQRIDDVSHLRKLQFAEDAGALAHPIRPEEYIEINNFYTMTVYEKGAEVIRMFRTLLGVEKYRKATDLYFSRHDGQAATCEDWIACMQEAGGIDLEQFKLWYSQAGTPRVDFKGHYDPDQQRYSVTLRQHIPDTPGQTDKQPMHIPIALGLIATDGNEILPTTILHLKQTEQQFTFDDIAKTPVPSVLRHFSAPVKLETDLDDTDYLFLSRYDTDGFNRWEAAQIVARRVLNRMSDQVEARKKPSIDEAYIDSLGAIIETSIKESADTALLARMLDIPCVSEMMQLREKADPESIFKARDVLLAAIKREHKPLLLKAYKHFSYLDDPEKATNLRYSGDRAFRNKLLALITSTRGSGCAKMAYQHYQAAANMTDKVAALSALAGNKNAERDKAFAEFYDRFKAYPLVVDKWFALQASAPRQDIIKQIKKLSEHSDFNIKNPNRARSLYAAFAMNNPAFFHAKDGSGYAFLSDAVIELNHINPQIAARLLTPLRGWRSLCDPLQIHAKQSLERILASPDLAPDIFEIASKSLKG